MKYTIRDYTGHFHPLEVEIVIETKQEGIYFYETLSAGIKAMKPCPHKDIKDKMKAFQHYLAMQVEKE